MGREGEADSPASPHRCYFDPGFNHWSIGNIPDPNLFSFLVPSSSVILNKGTSNFMDVGDLVTWLMVEDFYNHWMQWGISHEAPNYIYTINPFHLCHIVRLMCKFLLWYSRHYVVTLGSPYFRARLAVLCFIYKRARVSGACLSIGSERTNDQWECGQRGSVSLALSEFSRIFRDPANLELPKCLPVSLSSPKMDFLDKRLKEPLRFLAKVRKETD